MAAEQGLFAGKAALVTGAASGIGRATALAFAKEGAQVALIDIAGQRDAGEAAAREIAEAGGEALFIACDVSKEEDVQAMIKQTLGAFGRLDCAFNNAGVEGARGETHECETENWDRVIGVNLRGLWFCMKAELPQMLAQGGGAIVNCASVAGLVGFSGIPAYVASKHGVVGITRAAALEYAERDIRINAVCPGVIETPMVERLVSDDRQLREVLLASEPMGRVGRPEEIASAVLWLCSDGASFTTGHAMAVDGGWTAK